MIDVCQQCKVFYYAADKCVLSHWFLCKYRYFNTNILWQPAFQAMAFSNQRVDNTIMVVTPEEILSVISKDKEMVIVWLQIWVDEVYWMAAQLVDKNIWRHMSCLSELLIIRVDMVCFIEFSQSRTALNPLMKSHKKYM